MARDRAARPYARSREALRQNRAVSEFAGTLPWLVQGIAVAFVVAVLVSEPFGRWLRVRRSVAWLAAFSLGVILAGTLSPQEPPFGLPPGAARTCDLTRMGLAPPSELVPVTDATLNILLFAPLGLAIGLAPSSARKAIVLLGAAALPFAIEGLQLLVTLMRRGCESADVVDNLTGLVIGLLAALVVTRVAPGIGRPPWPDAPEVGRRAGDR